MLILFFNSAVKPRSLLGATFLKFLAGRPSRLQNGFYSLNCYWKKKGKIEKKNKYCCRVEHLLVKVVPNLCPECKYMALNEFHLRSDLFYGKKKVFFCWPFLVLIKSPPLPSCAEDESAFDLLYCITFKLMDHQWLAMHASYMDFNVRVDFY